MLILYIEKHKGSNHMKKIMFIDLCNHGAPVDSSCKRES